MLHIGTRLFLLWYNEFMTTVTIPKNEYQSLKRQSAAYRKIASQLFKAVVRDDVASVVRDFTATGLYTKEFLASLERGLSKSSYSRA